MVQIHVLGPMTVFDEQLEPVVLAPKPRRLLALLAVNADRAVSVNSLMQELWGSNPPRTATATIQTYIGHVRRTLAEALRVSVAEVAEEILVTEGGSYLLSTARVALDITEYERLAAAGSAAVQRGEFVQGSDLLRQAVALWRGPALVNVEAGELLGARIVHLDESKLCAEEQRVYADLQRGAHHTLVPELTELTARHPLHENFHRHLMLALYRSGRRAESLAVMRRLRSRLVEELGLEPSPFLVQMEQDILRGEPSLDGPRLGAADRCAGRSRERTAVQSLVHRLPRPAMQPTG
ncbi:AfsR/SARP family transcriptional regulator [Streptomyces glomeratus]|uniref:OmpR/PhoB-type domain-containing protein n=1 Tax=Streptomyces glomeratus TaxID=284452 RepID=A0ABP6LJH7_9ACTN|nr:AfsR/SARP family transcriptional regulator [Streptomyces glomeratus]MCF1506668.1 AfsR/SARP family transcriptional regulator [Streptomyces glomeratus]